MFKKTMQFDDLDGNEVSQTFYFNYNKKEIAELLEFKQLEEKLRILSIPTSESGLSEIDNNKQAYDIFQDLILDAYGRKGDDNVTFEKNETLRNYWKSHVAFVELIFEFLENPPLAAEFVENCMPAKLVARVKAEIAAESKGQIPSTTITEMVAEADRRQQDPATRIEPGIPADADPTVLKLAESITGNYTDGGVPEIVIEDLTATDILEMDEVSFNKLDVMKLSKEQMMVAFRRKSQG